MTGRTRSTSEWTLGLLIAAAFFLASGSPVIALLEGYVLAFGERFTLPATGSGSVVVVALDP
ncbi:MAG: hypothetical protein WCZ20_12425, partial [Hydrogenophaga sp.]